MGWIAASAPVLRAASLFDLDPELSEQLDARQRSEVRSRAIVPVADLPPGPWAPASLLDAASRPFGVMVVEGLLLREILLAGSTATELLGPCDIVAVAPVDDRLLPTETVWSVPREVRIAILDDRLLQILRSWPAVGRLLLARAGRREARLSAHRAIAQLPRVELRLLAFFAHLSERWGRVGSAGVVMPLHLTHETLGRLIGARRPTVSLALKDLATEGLLQRRDDGSWVLGYDAFERLGAVPELRASWHPADAWRLAEAEPAAETERPAPAPAPVRPVSDAQMAALRARIETLRAEHSDRVSRCAATLERTRATHEEIRRLLAERAE
jgi:CRP/FNR family transcriptional regulator, cyclic AMP receptor protein